MRCWGRESLDYIRNEKGGFGVAGSSASYLLTTMVDKYEPARPRLFLLRFREEKKVGPVFDYP